MNKNRIAISNYGSLLGQSLLTVVIDPIDKKFKEKIAADPAVINLSKPFPMYVIEPLLVQAVRASKEANGQQIIVINEGSNGVTSVEFTLAKGLLKPTRENFNAAITAAIEGETSFFSGADYPALFEATDKLNKRNADRMEELCNELMEQNALLKNLRENQKMAFEREMEDFDQSNI